MRKTQEELFVAGFLACFHYLNKANRLHFKQNIKLTDVTVNELLRIQGEQEFLRFKDQERTDV